MLTFTRRKFVDRWSLSIGGAAASAAFTDLWLLFGSLCLAGSTVLGTMAVVLASLAYLTPLFACGAVAAIVLYTRYKKANARYRRLLSQYFGIEIRPKDTPLLRPGMFEQWCLRHGLEEIPGPRGG
jgi:hypothetical protein